MIINLINKFRKIFFIVNLFVFGFCSYLASLALNVFLARNLSPAVYGDYSLGYKLLFLLAGLISVGSQGATLFFFPRFISEKKEESAQDFVHWNFKIWLCATVLSTLLLSLVFFILFFSGYFDLGSVNKIHISVFMAVFAPCVAASTILAAYLLVYGDYLFSQTLTSFSYNVVFLAVFVFCIKLLRLDVNDADLILITLGTTFLSLLVTLIVTMLKSKHWRKLNFAKAVKQRLTIGRGWLIYSVQICLSYSIQTAIFSMELLLLELIHPDENSVGKFAAMNALGSIIYLVPSALYNNYRKNISVYLSNGKVDLLQVDLDKINRVTFVFSGVLVVVIALFSHFFLSLFGHFYTDIKLALLIFLIGGAIQNFAVLGVQLLQYGGFPKLVIYVNIFVLASLTVLGGIFTCYWGVLGMAIARLVVNCLQVLIYSILVRKKLNMKMLSVV